VERQRLVQQHGVARSEQVLAEREQRPEDDVAVRIVGADVAVALEEHEPLGPVAAGTLRAEDAAQQVAHRRQATLREQQLDGALADVARAPAAAGVLLQAARREVVHQCVVLEPGQHRAQRVGLAVGAGKQRGLQGVERRCNGWPGLHQRPTQAQPDGRCGGQPQAQHGHAVVAAIVEQRFRARGLRDSRRAVERGDLEATLREARVQRRARRAGQPQAAIGAALRLYAARHFAIVAVQRQVQRDEAGRSRAFECTQ
jgi:hypothetical protein